MNKSSDLHSENIEVLVTNCQKGDSTSFADLYDIFLQPIYRYVFYRVGSDEAEDLTEMIFLKTWENIRQYRRGESSFSSWIFRIAHNVVIDYYRGTKNKFEELPEEIEDRRSDARTDIHTRRVLTSEILADALKSIKDQYRQIIILKYVNDLSNEEIGEILDKSQTALRILQFRALRHLKEILEKKGIKDSNL